MAEPPVVYNLQPLLNANVWGFFGLFGVELVMSSILMFFIVYKKYASRPRSYRDIFFTFSTSALALLICSISVNYWNDIIVTVWNEATAQSAYYQFLGASIGFSLLTICLISFAPTFSALREAVEVKKRHKHEIKNAQQNRSAGEEEYQKSNRTQQKMHKPSDDIMYTGLDGIIRSGKEINEHDIYGSTNATITPQAWLFGAATFFGTLMLTFQQAYPLALWYLAGVSMFIGLVLLIAYIWFMYCVTQLPWYIAYMKGSHDLDKKARKKTHRAYLAILAIHMLCSLAGTAISAGMTPAMATEQPQFSTSTGVTILYTCLALDNILILILSIYINVININDKSDWKSA